MCSCSPFISSVPGINGARSWVSGSGRQRPMGGCGCHVLRTWSVPALFLLSQHAWQQIEDNIPNTLYIYSTLMTCWDNITSVNNSLDLDFTGALKVVIHSVILIALTLEQLQTEGLQRPKINRPDYTAGKKRQWQSTGYNLEKKAARLEHMTIIINTCLAKIMMYSTSMARTKAYWKRLLKWGIVRTHCENRMLAYI